MSTMNLFGRTREAGGVSSYSRHMVEPMQRPKTGISVTKHESIRVTSSMENRQDEPYKPINLRESQNFAIRTTNIRRAETAKPITRQEPVKPKPEVIVNATVENSDSDDDNDSDNENYEEGKVYQQQRRISRQQKENSNDVMVMPVANVEDDLDDDEDENSAKILGSIENELKSSASSFDFVMQPMPKDCMIKCCIKRTKKFTGPVYTMYFERADKSYQAIMVARAKMKYANTYFKIYALRNSIFQVKRSNDEKSKRIIIGTLKSNLLKRTFELKTNDSSTYLKMYFSDNKFTFQNKPRTFNFDIPEVNEAKKEIRRQASLRNLENSWIPYSESCKSFVVEKFNSSVMNFQNKLPVYRQNLQSYCLNFGGRVTESSVNNFQIVSEWNPDKIIMQVGKVSKNMFICDFAHPLSPFQAFSVAISAFSN